MRVFSTAGVLGNLNKAIERMHPAYFAVVMATGIVSIASHFLLFERIALGLFWLNILFYAVLWIFTLLRLTLHPVRMWEDLQDFKRGVGYLTTVAGTCVLGSQFILLADAALTAAILLVIGTALWLFFIFSVFGLLTTVRTERSIAEGIDGGWLLATVSTQAISIESSLLSSTFARWTDLMLFGSLCLFFIGGLLYVMTITLIFYRLIFYDVEPAEMTSPYWINMGAVAISTLAGAVLAQVGSKNAYLEPVMPFIIGLTIFFWANATWWIPLLVVFGIWRYVVRKFPMSYSVEYWSMVFPLGMYTACTFRLSQIVFTPELSTIPHVTFWFALAAWMLTFAGLVGGMLKYLLDSAPRWEK